MLNSFLQVDLLGKLYIEDIFLFYEEPLLFSCKNLLGHVFLANCIDLEEDNKTWLLLPITPYKLLQLKKGTVSVYDAFKNPEEYQLWRVTLDPEHSYGVATFMNHNELTPEDLPTEDAYIEIEDIPENVSIYENFRHDLAKKENRVLLDISLEINQGHSTEISPEILSKSVMEIQNTIYSIAHKSGSINSNFPKTIIEDNQLSITGTYAASFGIRFMSKQLCNIFGDVQVAKNIETFLRLLESKSDAVKIREILDDLNPKVGLHYKKILTVLIKNNANLKTYYATPMKSTKDVFLTVDEIKDSLDTLESEISNKSSILSYRGRLVGVNVDSKAFSFIPDDEKKIEGKLSIDVNVEKFTVPLDVNVEIEEKLVINQLTRKEQVEYTLMSVSE